MSSERIHSRSHRARLAIYSWLHDRFHVWIFLKILSSFWNILHHRWHIRVWSLKNISSHLESFKQIISIASTTWQNDKNLCHKQDVLFNERSCRCRNNLPVLSKSCRDFLSSIWVGIKVDLVYISWFYIQSVAFNCRES